MFGRLPHDLINVILEIFLDVSIASLSTLDVACCCRSTRREALAALAQVRLRPINRTVTQPSLNDCLVWIARRELKCFIDADVDVGTLDINSSSTHRLPIAKILFTNHNQIEMNEANVTQLLQCCPDLKEVECRSFETAVLDRLLQLVRTYSLSSLTALNLLFYKEISPSVFAETMESMGDTLQELTCEGMDKACLAVIANTCHKLKSLTTTNQFIGDEELSTVCEQLSSHLEVLSFNEDEDAENENPLELTDACILAVSSCLLLRKLSFFMDLDEVRAGMLLQAVAANCACVEHVFVCWSEFNFVNDRLGRRVCDVSWGGRSNNEVKLCDVLPFRSSVNTDLYADVLDLMGAKSGSMLETVKGCLRKDVTDLHIARFLRRCPNLTTVHLFCLGAPYVTHLSLSKLFAHCPAITTLHLTGCNDISDNDFMEMLRGYHAIHLKSFSCDKFLSLEQSLKEPVRNISYCFPALIWLGICKPGFSRTMTGGIIGPASTLRVLEWNTKLVKDAGLLPARAVWWGCYYY